MKNLCHWNICIVKSINRSKRSFLSLFQSLEMDIPIKLTGNQSLGPGDCCVVRFTANNSNQNHFEFEYVGIV